MSTLAGLNGLARGLRAYLALPQVHVDVPVLVTFGKLYDRKDGMHRGGRIVLMPGEVPPGEREPKPRAAGRIDREGEQNVTIPTGKDPPNDTQLVRALGWWHYRLTMAVFAADADEPQNEERQIELTEGLLETAHQGICQAVDPQTGMNVGFGNVEEFGEPMWVVPPGEQAFGREIWTYYTLIVPLLDLPPGLAYPSPVVTRDPPA